MTSFLASFSPSAVALKNQQGNVENTSGDDGKPSDWIPEGELLLQVGTFISGLFWSVVIFYPSNL